MLETIAPYNAMAVPLNISDDTVALGLLRLADHLCMYEERRGHIERRWAFDKQWAKDNDVKYRRTRVAEYDELKVQIDVLRTALRTMLGPMMNADDVPVGQRSYLVDAAADNVIAAAALERQRARDTEQPQWYRPV